jgi:ubiquinone/menaquinone biosynthesis C-methylase UbiE/uncharacterized protein YbaR (Trm112 family)
MRPVCPIDRGSLASVADALVCETCGTSYAVVDGVPLLVPGQLSAQHEHQRAYFDAEFSHFAEYEVADWRASFNDRMFPALGITDGRGPYLDVGVGGSGATVIEAARAGVEAAGCDLSVEGVLHAAHYARDQGVADRTALVVSTAEHLPFADESFASASAVALLEHLDDDDVAVAELARVVRPGGRVWITVPHAYRHMPPFVWPAYWLHDRRIGHKRHYDDARLRRLVERHGFRHVDTQFTGHPVKLAQYALSLFESRAHRSFPTLWWRLERADLKAVKRPFWAIQLSAVASHGSRSTPEPT